MPKRYTRLQDIANSEKTTAQGFYNAWLQGTLGQFLIDHPNFNNKIIDASSWNLLINKIDDNTGTNAETWDSGATYDRGLIVKYQTNLYVSLQENTNHAPSGSTTSNDYWAYVRPFASAIDSTANSIVGLWNKNYNKIYNKSTNYRNNDWSANVWTSGTNYKKNELVKLDTHKSYYCLQDHTANSANKPPNATYWIPASIFKDSVGIQIATTEPSNIIVNDLWIKKS